MSTNPSSTNTGVFENTTRFEAVAMAGIIMAALIGLVILRFAIVIIIDVVCLGDLESARRSIGGVLRRVFPWWHPRTQPDTDLTSRNSNSTEIRSTLRERSLEDRKRIVAAALQERVSAFHWIRIYPLPYAISCSNVSVVVGVINKVLAKTDLERLRGVSETPTSADDEASICSNYMCSICLLDFGKEPQHENIRMFICHSV